MNFITVSFLAVGLVCLICVSRACVRAGHPFRTALLHAAGGIVALAAVNLLAGYTLVSLPLNNVSSFVTVVLGVPGVISLLLFKILLLL